MVELMRTNDLVLISAVEAMLAEMGSRSSSPINSRARSKARSAFCRAACWSLPMMRRRRGAC